MQWCFDIVSGIGWGSLLLMIGAVGVLWLVAAFGMAVLFRTSIQDGRRHASPRTDPRSPPVLVDNELGRRR
jgi:hypothetical protein